MSKFESSPIEITVKRHLERCFDGTPRLICGVSGGVDSMVLLHVLHRVGVGAGLLVVHVNYQLRGRDSMLDQELVEEICLLNGIECVSVRLDPEASEGNFQAWAREQRYDIFRGLMREEAAEGIATAHHQTDQIETIFQRVMRGAGVDRLDGIQLYERDLFRPLLSFSKEDIREYAHREGLLFREDRSNDEPGYSRNFLRLRLTPELDHFFPGWQENILALRDRAEEFTSMQKWLLDSVLEENGHSVSRSALVRIPRTLWPPVLSAWIELRTGNVRSRGVTRQFSAIDSLQTGQSVQAGPFVWLMRDRDRFLLTEKPKTDEMAFTLERKDLQEGMVRSGVRFELEPWNPEQGFITEKLHLDADRLQFPLTLRRWKEGDRIQPLGMRGSRLISDLLTDRKVSSAEKKSAQVLLSFDQTVCAVIFPHLLKNGSAGTVAEACKCSEATNLTLTLSFR